MANRILDIRGLTVDFKTEEGTVHAVEDVSFYILRGEIVGLVGESGCGKTVTSLSILRLLASPPGYYRSGEVIFEGKNLLKVDQKDIRRVRGSRIAYIFQDPMTSLNPVKRVGDQIAETIKLHQGLDQKQSFRKAIDMMELVGIPSAAQRARDYPYQFSGGMRQRGMIAIALSCNPELLIADEPTTALDVTIQAQILEIMRNLQRRYHLSILFITHDLGIVSEMCHRVIVMYGGKVVEIALVSEIFSRPQHPYTVALIRSRPEFRWKGRKLSVIGGTVCSLINPPPGCRFWPRCVCAMPICRERTPVLVTISSAHKVACHMIDKQS
jgi:oligopeptide/dipeptide ABC transporter ATP-binding protein